MKILFQADVRGVPAERILALLGHDPEARAILDDVDEVEQDAGALPDEKRAVPAAGDAVPDVGGPAERTTQRRASANAGTAQLDGFTHTLVVGVSDHLDEVDAMIARFARRWQVSRMPTVDRSVLRLATYELLRESTPPAVVIDEAVRLAKTLSTNDSGRYVNGVLESVRRHLTESAPPGGPSPTSTSAGPALDDAPAPQESAPEQRPEQTPQPATETLPDTQSEPETRPGPEPRPGPPPASALESPAGRGEGRSALSWQSTDDV